MYKALPPKVQETLQKRGRRNYQSQRINDFTEILSALMIEAAPIKPHKCD